MSGYAPANGARGAPVHRVVNADITVGVTDCSFSTLQYFVILFFETNLRVLNTKAPFSCLLG